MGKVTASNSSSSHPVYTEPDIITSKEAYKLEFSVEEVTAYEVGKPDSLVVVIPKAIRRMLSVKKGAKFNAKIDEKGRIIYEPIRGCTTKQSDTELVHE